MRLPENSSAVQLAWKLLGYRPNPSQKAITDAWFGTDLRFCLICGGERAGKSLTSVALFMPFFLASDGNFWIVGPDYSQARVEFAYIYDALMRSEETTGQKLIAEVSMPNGTSMAWSMRTTWGAFLTTRTADNVQKLASFRINGFIIVEAGQVTVDVWLKLRGRVAETRGFGILSGTLERGLPWYPDLLERWKVENPEGGKSFSLPTWSNIDVFPGGRNDPEIKALEAAYSPGLFMERYGAEPQISSGVVLKEFVYERHVRPLEPLEGPPIELWVDPGTNCYCVLFVQYVAPFAYVLDAVYERSAIDHDVIEQVKSHPLFPRVSGGVIDIAGTHRNQGGKSQVALWKDIADVTLAYKYCFENDSIEVLRYHLANDLIVFDSGLGNSVAADGTAMGVLAEPRLWVWPERGFRQDAAKRPIDQNNHAMKALAYGLIWHTGFSVQPKRPHRVTIRRYL